MQNIIYYCIASSIICFILACMWRKENWLNFILKLLMFGLSFWGGFLALQLSGYLIHVS